MRLSKNIFGLDISDSSLRVVKLEPNFYCRKISLTTANEIKLPKDCIKDGVIQNPEIFCKTTNELLKSAKITSKEVSACLPETKTFVKVIKLQIKPNEEKIDKIHEEIKKHIPLPINEAYLDWKILRQQNNKYTILLGIAPKTIVDSYTNNLISCGLIPIALEVESMAITRSILTKTEQNSDQQFIIIDLGATRSSLIFYDHGSIQFTTGLSLSGNSITKTIANSLKLNQRESEKAKLIFSLDSHKSKDVMMKIMITSVKQLITKIVGAQTFYQSQTKKISKPNKIILTGGGSNLKGLDAVITKKLKIKTVQGNPLININGRIPRQLSKTNLSNSYTTAIGLASYELPHSKE